MTTAPAMNVSLETRPVPVKFVIVDGLEAKLNAVRHVASHAMAAIRSGRRCLMLQSPFDEEAQTAFALLEHLGFLRLNKAMPPVYDDGITYDIVLPVPPFKRLLETLRIATDQPDGTAYPVV